MTKKLTRECKRCKGTGAVKSPVVHLGFPGLCFRCDGSGVEKFKTKEELNEESVETAKLGRESILEHVELLKGSLSKGFLEEEDVEYELVNLRKSWKRCTPRLFTKGKWGK